MNILTLNTPNLRQLIINLGSLDKEIEEFENSAIKIRTKINDVFWELIELRKQNGKSGST